MNTCMEVKEQCELEWCEMFTASYNHDVSHGTSAEHQKIYLCTIKAQFLMKVQAPENFMEEVTL